MLVPQAFVAVTEKVPEEDPIVTLSVPVVCPPVMVWPEGTDQV